MNKKTLLMISAVTLGAVLLLPKKKKKHKADPKPTTALDVLKVTVPLITSLTQLYIAKTQK